MKLSGVFILIFILLIPLGEGKPEFQEEFSIASIQNTFIEMDTTMGSIKISLYNDFAPVTVQNFLDLIEIDFYDGLVFHRVIDDFVIQGGGYDTNGVNKQSPFGPIDLEIHPDARHIDGAIGMARTNDPNSATSQFYICDGPQHFLDDNYAVFGVVVEGIQIVRNIASVQTETRYGLDDWPVEDIVITDITPINQDTWYVDDDNTEGPWDGTSVHPFQYIQDAIDMAQAQDTILIQDGFYDESLQITVPVHLIGQSKENTVITSTSSNDNLIVENASFTTISQLSFQSNQQGPLNSIKLMESDHCTVDLVHFSSQTLLYTAVTIEGSSNTLTTMRIDGGYAGTGVSVESGQGNIIKNNIVNACTAGIYVLRSNENQIKTNHVTNCSKGVYLEEGKKNMVTGNQIQGNEQGVFCSYASDNIIEQNNFIENIEQAKFAKFLQIGFLAPNRWNMNYWDDFNGMFVKPIFGLIYVPVGQPMGFFLPWYEFDFNPASSSYPFFSSIR
jgi:parallel beta-helix repeat protein